MELSPFTDLRVLTDAVMRFFIGRIIKQSWLLQETVRQQLIQSRWLCGRPYGDQFWKVTQLVPPDPAEGGEDTNKLAWNSSVTAGLSYDLWNDQLHIKKNGGKNFLKKHSSMGTHLFSWMEFSFLIEHWILLLSSRASQTASIYS